MRQRLRIAVVISHPIQHFCPQYANWSADDGWNLKVFFASTAGFTPYADPQFGGEVRWAGLNLSAFPHEFMNDEKNLPISPRLDADGLERRLDRYNPDVLVVYGYAQRLQRRALRWGAKNNRTVLMFSDSELRHRRSLDRRIAKRLWLPRHYRQVTGFLTTGDANEEYYRHYNVSDDRLFRCPYPIDVTSFEQAFKHRATHRSELRRELGIAADQTVVLMVGKFVPWKRQIDLIRMLHHDQSLAERLTVVLVGAGEKHQELERAAAVAPGQVLFSGFVQPEALPRYYAAADIYAHTAEREPHSVAISEAIFMGCPVVVSDRCGSYGPTDDVQPGRNGFVYGCGNSRQLGAQIGRLAAQSDLRRNFSSASRAIGVQKQTLSHGEGLKAAVTALTKS